VRRAVDRLGARITRRGSTWPYVRALRRRPEPAGPGERALGRLFGALAREPLVHFLILAALLFAAYALLAPAGENRIVIDRAAVDRLVAEREMLLLRPLSEAEREAALQTLIDDELLLREAYRRGLDQDAVVRQHLVQKMRLILGEDQPEPSEAELRAFLESNRERYRTPPTVTLEHLFYADAAAAPPDLTEQSQDGPDLGNLGEHLLMLGPRPNRYSLQDLLGLVGPDVARRVFELPVGIWHGPIASARGVHFVQVVGRQPAKMLPFEELADSLRQDWFLARQEQALAAKLGELRANYRIVVEDAPR
jgi:PPIC-type PPIASE domain